MQERTCNDRARTLRQPAFPYSYYAMPAAIISGELLNEEKELQHLTRSGGICYARIERQVCKDLFRIRIAADPSHLDNECAHLLFVSSTVLHAMTEIFQISAAIIPGELLGEEDSLQQVARQEGQCPAFIQRQIRWDLYSVRLAADSQSLFEDERSHTIYLSQSEMQAYIKLPPEWEFSLQAATAPATPPDFPERQEPVVLVPLEVEDVSEEDLRAAASTLDITEVDLSGKSRRPGSKPWRQLRSLIELVLYRAVLRAAAHKKVIQETIRRVLVSRKQFSKRLISICDMYMKDGHAYWSIQVNVPSSLL
jgi:hypothetical protein